MPLSSLSLIHAADSRLYLSTNAYLCVTSFAATYRFLGLILSHGSPLIWMIRYIIVLTQPWFIVVPILTAASNVDQFLLGLSNCKSAIQFHYVSMLVIGHLVVEPYIVRWI